MKLGVKSDMTIFPSKFPLSGLYLWKQCWKRLGYGRSWVFIVYISKGSNANLLSGIRRRNKDTWWGVLWKLLRTRGSLGSWAVCPPYGCPFCSRQNLCLVGSKCRLNAFHGNSIGDISHVNNGIELTLQPLSLLIWNFSAACFSQLIGTKYLWAVGHSVYREQHNEYLLCGLNTALVSSSVVWPWEALVS